MKTQIWRGGKGDSIEELENLVHPLLEEITWT